MASPSDSKEMFHDFMTLRYWNAQDWDCQAVQVTLKEKFMQMNVCGAGMPKQGLPGKPSGKQQVGCGRLCQCFSVNNLTTAERQCFHC